MATKSIIIAVEYSKVGAKLLVEGFYACLLCTTLTSFTLHTHTYYGPFLTQSPFNLQECFKAVDFVLEHFPKGECRRRTFLASHTTRRFVTTAVL